MIRRRNVGAALLATLLVGCTSGSSRTRVSDPFQTPGAVSDRVVVLVQNRNSGDVTLTAVVDGRRTRMGTVLPRSNETFVVPMANPGNVQVEIELVGRDRYRTPPVNAQPGDQLVLFVEQSIQASRLRH